MYRRLASLFRRTANTLKFKIVALTVVTGIAASLGSVELALDAEARDLGKAVLDGQARDAEATAMLLGDKLNLLQSALQAVAEQVPTAAWREPSLMTRYLVDKPALNRMFDMVSAADAQGVPIVRLKQGIVAGALPNLAGEEYFQRALRSDQPVVSRPFIGPLTGTPLVVLTHPVVDADGRVLGVLLGVLPLRSTGLFSLLGTRSRQGLEEVVLDRYGVVLSHPDPERIMSSALSLHGVRAIVRTWLDSGAPIDTIGTASRADGQFVALAGIPGSDWVVVRATDERVALAAVYAARSQAWQVAAGVGLLASVLAGVLGWAVIRPITRLRERAERLTRNPDVEGAWPSEEGEIGRLARAFAALFDERRRGEQAARDLLLQLHAVLDHAKVGIVLVRGGTLQLASAELACLLGRPANELLGMPVARLFAEPPSFERRRANANANADTDTDAARHHQATDEFDYEAELARADGQRVWCRLRGRALVPGVAEAGAIWTIADVTDTRSQHARLSWVATHDPLTGLENRAAFEAAVGQACAAAGPGHFAVLFIDLDRFKQVNDLGGHAAGDAMLKGLAATMLAHVRQTDTLARLGGDEFAVLLPNCPQPWAERVGDKLRLAVAAHALYWRGQRFDVGASIGVVLSDGQPLQVEDLLASADAACYEAKRAGRGRVRVGPLLRQGALAAPAVA